VLVLHNCISLGCQLPKNNDKSSPLSAAFAENCAPQQKMQTLTKLLQFAGHGQNCELAAKRENHRKQFSARNSYYKRSQQSVCC